ncbi:MAG TPA: cytidylate kinase family protein [Candidatus Binataceae bacterium]|nr:cytidylate kinase family protein [Candidatus Binataceae bacterium]
MALIVINQQLGSRGAELGEMAARELGYRFLGRSDIVSAAASEFNVEPSQFLIIDERQPHFWERSKADTERLISFLRAVAYKMMAQDRVVFVSSSGAHLLPDNGCGLRVRVMASFESRARTSAAIEGLSQASAEKRVRDFDREVKARQQTLYGFDIDDPAIYHLVLNTSTLPLEVLVASLKASAEQLDRRCDARAREEIRDLAVAAQVRAALLCHPKFGLAQISVACSRGVVKMQGPGLVPPWDDLARQVVSKIDGVKSCEIGAEEPPLPLRSE